MLRVIHLYEFNALLLDLDRIVGLMGSRDQEFCLEAKSWMQKLEDACTRNRLMIAGNIAALRGLLLSAEDGHIPAEIQPVANPTKRKVRKLTASYTIRQASSMITQSLQKDIDRIYDSRRVMRQLISMANLKGYLKDKTRSNWQTGDISKYWNLIHDDKDFISLVVNLEGALGPTDILVVFDQMLTEFLPE